MVFILKKSLILALVLVSLVIFGCAYENNYANPDMDFGAIQTVAVMPFANLTKDSLASERVRDVFVTMLLSSGGVYVIPTGEVMRKAAGAGMGNPIAPTPDEVIKFCKLATVDAVITGVVREYGEIKSGTTVANVISVSMQLMEGQTGTVVWAADSTKGGIGLKDRLLGGGGEPLNVITEKALNEIIQKLFS